MMSLCMIYTMSIGENVENEEKEVFTPSNDVIIDVHNSKEVPKESSLP